MSTIESILLGIIQGLTEFLPVSSSGHLILFQSLLGMKDLDNYVLFDLICHLGTLTAILIVLSTQIKEILFRDRHKILLIIIGTLPLFPLVVILKPIKALFNQTEYLGFFFMLTALILYLGKRFGWDKSESELNRQSKRDSLLIGMSQAFAVLPGISRSGTTISAGRVLGLPAYEAFLFSFLLAIPAILGGTFLEILSLFSHSQLVLEHPLSFLQYFAGYITSFVVGFASLILLKRLALENKLHYFAWYCLLVGIFSLFYFNGRS